MYYPYFRGKQFELISIRETAKVMAQAGFVPIIEPVKEALGNSHKALQTICEAGGNAIVIVNPYVGDHQENGNSITDLLTKEFAGNSAISAGILLREGMSLILPNTFQGACSAQSSIRPCRFRRSEGLGRSTWRGS
jgi:hypothetical protein